MKIRITQAGFERFTGDFGVIAFVDGVSAGDVSGVEIDRLAASIGIVDAETGEPIGVANRIVTHHADTAPVLGRLPTAAELEGEPEPAAPAPVDDGMPTFHTAEELGALADAGGIKAVREVAAKWDVRGKAIAELIGEILDAQEKFKKSRGIVDAPAA